MPMVSTSFTGKETCIAVEYRDLGGDQIAQPEHGRAKSDGVVHIKIDFQHSGISLLLPIVKVLFLFKVCERVAWAFEKSMAESSGAGK